TISSWDRRVTNSPRVTNQRARMVMPATPIFWSARQRPLRSGIVSAPVRASTDTPPPRASGRAGRWRSGRPRGTGGARPGPGRPSLGPRRHQQGNREQDAANRAVVLLGNRREQARHETAEGNQRQDEG